MDKKLFNLSTGLEIEPLIDASHSLGSTTKNFVSLQLDNGATDGGAIYFNAATTSFLKSSADGATLDIAGFTSITTEANAIGGSSLLATGVTGKLLTGLTATSGQVVATDTILEALGRLAGVSFPATGTLLADALTDGYIFVGSAGDVATGVAMSGEATIDNTGDVTLDNDSVIAKVLTGYSAGAGTVSASDSILEAIQKLDGNIAALPEGSGRRQIYDITSGTVPPSSGSVGTDLGFFQSEDFDPDTNNDIYFQFAVPDNVDITAPIKVVLKYCMGADNGGDVKLDLDYVVSDVADDVDPAAATATLTDTFTPGAGAELLRSHSAFEIDAADLDSVNTMVSCHLTRDAVDGTDTHTSTFQLLSVEIEYTPIELGSGGGGGGDVGDWVAFTPTGSWTTNATYSGFYRIVGDTMECTAKVLCGGGILPIDTNLTLELPTGYVIDTTKLPGADVGTVLGDGVISDNGVTGVGRVVVAYSDTDTVIVYTLAVSGSALAYASLKNNTPITFANTDFIKVRFSFPVVGV